MNTPLQLSGELPLIRHPESQLAPLIALELGYPRVDVLKKKICQIKGHSFKCQKMEG